MWPFKSPAEKLTDYYRKVYENHLAFEQKDKTKLATEIVSRFNPPYPHLFIAALADILAHNTTFPKNPPLEFETFDEDDIDQARRYLRQRNHFLENEEELKNLLASFFEGYARQIPKLEPSPFTVELHTYFTRSFTSPLFTLLLEHSEFGPFAKLKERMAMSLKTADLTKSISTEQLRGTKLYDLLTAPVPVHIPFATRFSHTHVIGGSGAGKTQLLQSLILHDLKRTDPPSIVVVDSQGDLIRNILNLDLPFDPILVSPKDNVALNIFDIKKRGYDESTREQVTAGAIQTFDYLFSGLFGADLTAKQGTFFRFVSRLLISLPETMGRNATIIDMLRVMEDAKPYLPAIERLPDIQREFFQKDFHQTTFKQTKDQIRYRLQAILENPTLARLFTSPESKLDIYQELNKGAVILVDTAKDFLKSASPHFGRIFISLILQAILERAVIPEDKRKPTFLIIDEAAQYFDQNIDELLTEARKYKCGVVLAHQFIDQCTPHLRASLAANTSIKFAGGLSYSDARHMAQEMNTDPTYFNSLPKFHFGCYVRDITKEEPYTIEVPLGAMEESPKRTDLAQLLARNKQRVHAVHPVPKKKVVDNSDSYDPKEW